MLKLTLSYLVVKILHVLFAPLETVALPEVANPNKSNNIFSNPAHEDVYDPSYSIYDTSSGSGDDTDDTEDGYLEPEGYDLHIDEQAVIDSNLAARNAVDTSRWFACDGDRVWLTRDKKCDGNRDCFDCSDEIDCAETADMFFYCYGRDYNSLERNDKSDFSWTDPFCIPRKKFCDGKVDCASGVDEQKVGSGFKCRIRNRFQSCLLPVDMICDSRMDCEDGSDICSSGGDDPSKVVPFPQKQEAYLTKPFHCLNRSSNVSVFQNQVCDGIVDCPDLSDECLCDSAASETLRLICDKICQPSVWLETIPSKSCAKCETHQVEICDRDFEILHNSTGKKKENCSCVDPADLCSSVEDHLTDLQEEICVRTTQERNFKECLSIDGSFVVVRAQMCDGRPECFFGEDECATECWIKQENETYWNEHFCSLLVPDAGFFCAEEDAMKATEELHTIVPCDGKYDCESEIDEKFCPTRFPCFVGNDESERSSWLADTYDIKQVCDGRKDCPNNVDEDATLCDKLPTAECANASTALFSSFSCKAQVQFHCQSQQNTTLILGGRSLTAQDITTAQRVIQCGLLVMAVTGSIGNIAGIIIAILNSLSLLKSQTESSFKHYISFVRESVCYLSVGLAKTLFSVYLAFVLLSIPEDAFLCAETSIFRIDNVCGWLGPLAFFSSNLTWFVLLLYITLSSWSVFKTKKKETVDEVNDQFLGRSKEPKRKTDKQRVVAWSFSTLALNLVILLPLITLVVWTSKSFNREMWISLKNAPALFIDKVANRTEMRLLSQRAAAVSGQFHSKAIQFSWQRAYDVMVTYAPSLGFEWQGVIGYYSYNTLCLPLHLAKPAHIFPDRSPAIVASFIFISLNCALCVCCFIVLVVSRASKHCVKCSRDEIDLSVADFCVAEIIAWLPIFFSYFLNLMSAGFVTDSLYQGIVLVSLSLNSGIMSVFLHFRKRRVKLLTKCSTPEEADDVNETSVMLNH